MSTPQDVYIMPFAANYHEFLKTQAQKYHPPPPELLSAFRRLFSEPSVPMLKIAREAVTPIIAAIPNEPDHTPDCDPLWIPIKEAIDQLTEYNDKFVDFVVELQKLPDGDHFFKVMPQFRGFWTEMVGHVTDYPSAEKNQAAKRQAQTNQHAFWAKLSAKGVPELDEIRKAGFTFRSTCEFAPWEKVHFPEIEEWYFPEHEDEWPGIRDRELERTSIRILNAKIPAAAQWIKHVGQRLYEMEGELAGEGDWQNDRFNVKWTGSKGWSKERFAFWRERFEWMTTITALEKSTQRIARECAGRMKEIEGGR